MGPGSLPCTHKTRHGSLAPHHAHTQDQEWAHSPSLCTHSRPGTDPRIPGPSPHAYTGQAPTRARWGRCSAGSGGRTAPPGGHRRLRRERARAARAKETGERTHGRQGTCGQVLGMEVPPWQKLLWGLTQSPAPSPAMGLNSPLPTCTGHSYLNGPKAEAIEQGSDQQAAGEAEDGCEGAGGSCNRGAMAETQGPRPLPPALRGLESSQRSQGRGRGEGAGAPTVGPLPVPPKPCISICSSRYMRQVLTWGRRPSRKTNGKHKVNTAREGTGDSQPAGLPAAAPAHTPPRLCPASPVATSRAQKKKEAEKSVRP